MPSLGKYLRTQTEQHGARHTYGLFTEALQKGEITDGDWSLRETADALLPADFQTQSPRSRMVLPAGDHAIGSVFPEAGGGDAVDSSMFANITGQILFQEIKRMYESADFVGGELCRVMPVTNKNLGEEKIPYLSPAVDSPPYVNQGQPYPRTSFGEQYLYLPAIKKFGEICQVTMEMIFSDHTLQAREAAQSVGERVRMIKEEMILQTVLGLVDTYKFNSTTAAATYQATTPYINKKSGSALTDADSINVAEQLLAEMVDPVTGKPIRVRPNALLVMPFNYRKMRRVMGASGLRVGDGASATLATYTPDYLDNDYPVLQTRWGYHLLLDPTAPVGNNLPGGGLTATNAREYWLLGDFKKAFIWRQAAPFQTFVAPPLAPEEFEKDIVLQVKAREWGSMGVYDPRYVALLYNA